MVIAAAALVISGGAAWYSKRSADAADRSATAAERSAAADESALEDARRAEEEANRPRADLKLDWVKKDLFRLWNAGNLLAANVTVQNTEALVRQGGVPAGESLAPGEGTEFLLMGSMQVPLPSQLWVTWDGQEEAVALPVPPKGMNGSGHR